MCAIHWIESLYTLPNWPWLDSNWPPWPSFQLLWRPMKYNWPPALWPTNQCIRLSTVNDRISFRSHGKLIKKWLATFLKLYMSTCVLFMINKLYFGTITKHNALLFSRVMNSVHVFTFLHSFLPFLPSFLTVLLCIWLWPYHRRFLYEAVCDRQYRLQIRQ